MQKYDIKFVDGFPCIVSDDFDYPTKTSSGMLIIDFTSKQDAKDKEHHDQLLKDLQEYFDSL